MPPNLDFEYRYAGRPIIPVVARAGTHEVGFSALIDTGADVTLLDEILALQLGLEVATLPRARTFGVGGGSWDVRLAEVTLSLLFEPELEAVIQVAFVPELALSLGNLLGRDVLTYFDFALEHSDQVLYLGRTEAVPA